MPKVKLLYTIEEITLYYRRNGKKKKVFIEGFSRHTSAGPHNTEL